MHVDVAFENGTDYEKDAITFKSSARYLPAVAEPRAIAVVRTCLPDPTKQRALCSGRGLLRVRTCRAERDQPLSSVSPQGGSGRVICSATGDRPGCFQRTVATNDAEQCNSHANGA